MKTLKTIIGGVMGGVVITLATAVYNATPAGLVGATWYGFPLGWLIKRVVAPQYNPWALSYTGLVVDLVVWFIVMFIILMLVGMTMKKK